MDNLEKYTSLQKQLDRITEEINKREGALMRINDELESEFGVKTMKAATTLLKKMKKENETEERLLEGLRSKFEERWGDVLTN